MTAKREVVLVTGGSGQIGSALVARLVTRYTVASMDLQGPDHSPPVGAKHIDLDVTSEESTRSALAEVRQRWGERIASVIHLAAYYDFSGEDSPRYDEITVRGTQRLLAGLKDLAVEQFIFSSTMLVHAPTVPGVPLVEDDLLDPKWPYPQSKVDTERLLREQHGTIPLVLLRIAGVYDDECHSIPLAHQIQRIRERWMTSTVYPGDTSRGQAFLHLDDLVSALERVIARRAQLPRETTLLLGEPVTLSYDALQRAFGRLLHDEEWTTRRVPKALAKTGAWLQDHLPFVEDPFIKPWMIDLADDHYELDISRARELLGWQPEHSLRETLPRMIAAVKRDPRAWYQAHKLTPPEELKEAVPIGTGRHSST